MGRRPQRIAEFIRREASDCILKLKDPGIGFVTITRVEITADLRHARLYYSALGEKKQKDRTVKKLHNAKGFIRKHIGEKLTMRFTPDITFIEDDSYEKMEKIENILAKLRKEKETPIDG